MPDNTSYGRSINGISKNGRVFFLIAIAIVISAGLILRTLHTKPFIELVPGIKPITSENFRPTKAQWLGLKVSPVRMMNFHTERSTEGYIAYNDDTMTPVFSPYSGRVTRVLAKPGDMVKKGTPLLAVAASEYVQMKNDLISAVNALKSAQEQVALSTVNEKRLHDLYLAKSAAFKDWLQSQTDLATTQNSLHIAETTLDTARDRLRIMGKSDEEIHSLEINPDGNPLSPESYVVAPITGTITQRQVGVGQFINSVTGGATAPVFTIGNLKTLWMVANVRETDAPFIRIGQPIEIHVLAYPEKKFHAKISWIAPSIDPSTHRLPVRAEVQNDDGSLKALMFANFSISTGKDSSSPGVPQSAVVYAGEDTRAYVVQRDGTIVLRKIKIGRQSDDGMLEVIEGLKIGEQIITSGTLFIDRAVTADVSS